MSSASAKLDALILRTERAAIAKAMCGLWTDVDDAHLAALYVERHSLLEKGTHHV